MNIARSTLYAEPTAAVDDTAVVEAISGICDVFEHYGWRRVRAALRHQGMVVNHKKIRRLMREHGLRRRRCRACDEESVTHGDYVRFVRNGTTYTVFSSFVRSSRPHAEAGVIVSQGFRVLSRLRCRDHDDGLGPDGWRLMYGAKLPQDRFESIEPASD